MVLFQVGIFLYDFASTASNDSKINQETKHIFILQNVLKNKPSSIPTKTNSTLQNADSKQRSNIHFIQDRSDESNIYSMDHIEGITSPLHIYSDEPGNGNEHLKMSKLGNAIIGLTGGEDERRPAIEGKQNLKNYAMLNQLSKRFVLL